MTKSPPSCNYTNPNVMFAVWEGLPSLATYWTTKSAMKSVMLGRSTIIPTLASWLLLSKGLAVLDIVGIPKGSSIWRPYSTMEGRLSWNESLTVTVIECISLPGVIIRRQPQRIPLQADTVLRDRDTWNQNLYRIQNALGRDQAHGLH
jgi:hypothetical protein